MFDAAKELEDTRFDVATLRTLIDVALDRGVRGGDLLFQACARVLQEKQRRLHELERVTLYMSRGDSVEQ